MKNKSLYLAFIREKGRCLSEINPGSSEIALIVDDAMEALELLSNEKVAILGADILTEHNGELVYAYQHWGDEYIYLNWYCDQMDSEDNENYLNRSYNVAKEGIANALKVAKEHNEKCYIVFVV